MALTFGAYAAPEWQRPLAVAAVVALTAVNYQGVRKTAVAHPRHRRHRAGIAGRRRDRRARSAARPRRPTSGRSSPAGGRASSSRPGCCSSPSPGYARIATLGEEVIDPARTIPRAIPLALGITLVVYAVGRYRRAARRRPRCVGGVAGTAGDRGAGRLARLARAGGAGGWHGRLARRAALAHRRRQPHHLRHGRQRRPAPLARPRPPGAPGAPPRRARGRARSSRRSCVPADLRGAIGFSSFAVLTYYAIANAAAWTLPPHQRRGPGRWPSPAWSAASAWPSASQRQRGRRLGGPRCRRRRLVPQTGAPALARTVTVSSAPVSLSHLVGRFEEVE